LAIAPAPWDPWAATVIGSGLLVGITIAVAGIVVDRSRLARGIGIGVLAVQLAVAAIRPIGGTWWVGVFLSIAAGVALAGRRLSEWTRRPPPVAAPPVAAVVLSMVLLAIPIGSALASFRTATGWIIAALSVLNWLILLCYVRRWRPAMLVVRGGLPLLAVAGLVALPPAAGTTWILSGLGASALAWTAGARLAIRPLVR
jgi:hypothetical protein